MKKILLPIDRSDLCTQGFEYAKDLAQKFEAKVIVLNIIEMEQNLHWVGYSTGFFPKTDVYEKVTKQKLEKAEEYFKASNIEVETKYEWGSPADKILDISEEEECDMIVMCTHGMSKTKRFLLGSVTDKVVHHAKIPVLVVR